VQEKQEAVGEGADRDTRGACAPQRISRQSSCEDMGDRSRIYFRPARCYNGGVLNDAIIWKSLKQARQLSLIAGPCVIENEQLCFQVASFLRAACRKLNIFYVFKASYDKANRSSAATFRGPGLAAGLAILAKIRR
jgi:hypothetical protein